MVAVMPKKPKGPPKREDPTDDKVPMGSLRVEQELVTWANMVAEFDGKRVNEIVAPVLREFLRGQVARVNQGLAKQIEKDRPAGG